MDLDTLERQIKAKADKEVQNKLSIFRTAVENAAQALCRGWGPPNCCSYESPCKELLLVLAGDYSRRKWPRELWAHEEKRIREEILSTMDTLQKVLLVKVPDVPYEDSAEPEKVPA